MQFLSFWSSKLKGKNCNLFSLFHTQTGNPAHSLAKKFFLHFIINEGTSEEGHKNPPLIIKMKVKNKSLTFKEENLKKRLKVFFSLPTYICRAITLNTILKAITISLWQDRHQASGLTHTAYIKQSVACSRRHWTT